ncbi:MAG: DUF502 domain-containing protein [Legionella sp.]
MNSKFLRSYLLAGLVVWFPIIITFVVLRFIVDLLDQTIALLPYAYRPEQLVGVHLPGAGVILSLVVLLATGLVATNFLGQRLMGWSESILERIPLVRSIYNASKQIIQAIFSTNSEAFRKVLLIEYPRKGTWTLAFQTGVGSEHVNRHLNMEMVSVFVPTTPNPTSGFLLMLPKSEVVELSMTVDEALKFTISLGVMQSSTVGNDGLIK